MIKIDFTRPSTPKQFCRTARIRIATAVAFASAVCSFEAAAQVSVSATGGVTAPTAYTTLNAAFTAINAGTHQGVINVSITGNTTEPATPVPLLASAGTSNYTSIIIKPSGGSFVINSDAAPTANRGIIELAGADNVIIDGDDLATAGTQNLSIVAAPVSTAGVACIRLSSNSTTGADGANNITVQNCIITGARNSATSSTTSYGIQFSNGTSTSSSSTGAYSSLNTLIQNNTITRCYYGISAIGNSTTYLNTGLIIRNNTLGSASSAENIGFRGILASYTSADGTNSASIVNNDIRCGDYGTTGYSATIAGIELGAANAGATITRNNIHDINQPSTSGWGAHGIYVTSGTSNSSIKITNNFIRDCKMYVYQNSLTSTYIPNGVFFTGAATNVVFNHNTIVMNAQLAASTTHNSACLNASVSGVTFAQVLNNIFVNNHASANAFAFATAGNGNISAGAVNNNNYFVNASAKVGYYNGASQALLSNWQTATGKDGASISENPTFTSATNLHIPAGTTTLMESGGASVATTGVNIDIDNQTRPGTSTYGFGTAPDMGADEFDGIVVYTCATPTPGATIASANNICFGTSVTFTVTNNTTGTGVSRIWQFSPDNTTYTAIAGASAPSYTVTPALPGFYRCVVTCANGPVSGTSTPIQLTFANNVTAALGATRCGTGTANLTATGNAGSTLRWYANLLGGASIGTGSPFTTPAISATTNYYVGAETITAGTAAIGDGALSGVDAPYNPANGGYGGIKAQYLITAAELLAAGVAPGNITNLSFDFTAAGASLTGFNVEVGTTALAEFPTPISIIGGLTPVYNTATFVPVVGLNNIPFSTPLNWNGTSNIIVSTSWSNNNSSNTSSTVKYDNNAGNMSQSYRKDNETAPNMLLFTGSTGAGTFTFARAQNRPKIVFGAQVTCSSPRTLVVATVNTPPTFTVTANKTACNNAITPISVTSALGNFNTYTWSPVANLYTDAAATVAYTAGTNASTVYMKSGTAAATTYTATANNSTTLCAAVSTITVTVLPASVTAVATPSALCVTGTTTISLVPGTGYGAASFQWQSATTNVAASFADVLGATSASYTTPVTTSNVFYRATIKNSDGVTCLNSSVDTARVYNPSVATTTPASRCGPGTLTLGATGVDGTLRWFAAATGGTSLASGNTFTTPSLTNTTTYYVQSESYPSVTGVVGAGGTTNSTTGITPFSQNWEGQRTQYLVTVADLNAAGIFAGSLSSVSFNISTKSSTMAYTGYAIKLGTTAATTLTAYQTSPLTTVYGPASFSSVAGTNAFQFTAPYFWDGTSNLIVEVCFENDPTSLGTFWTSNDEVTATTKTYTASYGMYADNAALCGAATGGTFVNSTALPVMTFLQQGCTSARTPVIATVNPVPTAAVTPAGPVAICAGNTTTLTASGGTSYQWRNAAGNIAGATNATYTTGTAGNYRAVVTNASGCSDTSAVVAVTVNPLPTVFIGNDTTFCSGNTLTLNAGNTGSTFLWNDNTTAQTKNVTASGTYYVKVTNANGCIKFDTIAVTVRPTPVVNLGNDTNICLGINYTLNAGNPGASYLWDNGTTAQTRTINNTGTYFVKVTNGFNCSRSDTVTANYLTSPIVNLGADIDACAGTPVTLNAGNPGETFVWDNGSTAQTRSVTSSGTYYVTVKNIANCKGSDTVAVVIHPLPIVNLGNDTVFCYDQTLTLNAGNPGASYLWNDNTTNQTLDVDATGNYSVIVTDNFGCIGTDNINILVKDPPSGVINAVYNDSATYRFNVLNPQYVTGYVWDFGDGSAKVTGDIVFHTYTQNGIYNVTVTLLGECIDSTDKSRTVDVFDATGGTSVRNIKDEQALTLYPNPAREYITLENKSNLAMQQIAVYNVLGQLLITEKAETKDKHQLQTAKLPSGIYTVRIETDKGMIVRKFEIMK